MRYAHRTVSMQFPVAVDRQAGGRVWGENRAEKAGGDNPQSKTTACPHTRPLAAAFGQEGAVPPARCGTSECSRLDEGHTPRRRRGPAARARLALTALAWDAWRPSRIDWS